MTTGCLTCWAMTTFNTSGTTGTLRMTETSSIDPNISISTMKYTPFLPAVQYGFFKVLNPGKLQEEIKVCRPSSLTYQVHSHNQTALLTIYASLTLHWGDPILDLPLSLEISFAQVSWRKGISVFHKCNCKNLKHYSLQHKACFRTLLPIAYILNTH